MKHYRPFAGSERAFYGFMGTIPPAKENAEVLSRRNWHFNAIVWFRGLITGADASWAEGAHQALDAPR